MKVLSNKFNFVPVKEIEKVSNKYSVTNLKIKRQNNCRDKNN